MVEEGAGTDKHSGVERLAVDAVTRGKMRRLFGDDLLFIGVTEQKHEHEGKEWVPPSSSHVWGPDVSLLLTCC